jgi:hypothetical protein
VSLADQTLELVFEGITINSKVDHFTPSYCEATDNNPRVQLAASTSGAEYTLLYQEQLRNIIEGYQVTAGQETPIDFEHTTTKPVKRRKTNKKTRESAEPVPVPEVTRVAQGMFPPGSERGTFANWLAAHNTVKGGEGYQHAHSDQGRYDEFMYSDVFPFVALHAFGVEEFKLWVLPQPEKRTFGFLHTFHPLNMVFMRGDFVHAGSVGTHPRGHMEFFPRQAAGWNRSRSWWNRKSNGPPPTFLFPKPTFPFGFPSASTANSLTGDVVLTYPPNLTKHLLVPLTEQQCIDENISYVPELRDATRKRKQACNEVQAQTW